MVHTAVDRTLNIECTKSCQMYGTFSSQVLRCMNMSICTYMASTRVKFYRIISLLISIIVPRSAAMVHSFDTVLCKLHFDIKVFSITLNSTKINRSMYAI